MTATRHDILVRSEGYGLVNRFGHQVGRLAKRQHFELRMSGRPDILDPQGGNVPPADKIGEHLVSGVDFVRDDNSDALLPRGLRLARYGLSPVIQAKIGEDGRYAGHKICRAPQSAAETDALVRTLCPIPQTRYSEMRRILYVDPPAYARLLESLRLERPEIVTLLLSREYELAVERCPLLGAPAGVKNYDGSLIKIARTFGEIERIDDIGAGLDEQSLSINGLREILTRQDLVIDHISRRTAVGEFLTGLLAHPDMIAAHTRDPALSALPAPFAPWALGNANGRGLVSALMRKSTFEAFVSFVRSLDFLNKRRVENRLLATYFGLPIDQFLLTAMIALGRSVIMERNDEPGQSRAIAMNGLADALLRRHAPELADSAKTKRDKQVAAMAKKYGWDLDLTEHAGASRNQRFRDAASLMTPGLDLPGHGSGVDPDMWKLRYPDARLWEALLSEPPSVEWLIENDQDETTIEVFDKIRAARKQMAGLFKPKNNAGRIRLAADLATAVGPLTGHVSYRDRLFDLVDNAGKLRRDGMLENRRGSSRGRTTGKQKMSAGAGNKTVVRRG